MPNEKLTVPFVTDRKDKRLSVKISVSFAKGTGSLRETVPFNIAISDGWMYARKSSLFFYYLSLY